MRDCAPPTGQSPGIPTLGGVQPIPETAAAITPPAITCEDCPAAAVYIGAPHGNANFCAEHGATCPQCDGAGAVVQASVVRSRSRLEPSETLESERDHRCRVCDGHGWIAASDLARARADAERDGGPGWVWSESYA